MRRKKVRIFSFGFLVLACLAVILGFSSLSGAQAPGAPYDYGNSNARYIDVADDGSPARTTLRVSVFQGSGGKWGAEAGNIRYKAITLAANHELDNFEVQRGNARVDRYDYVYVQGPGGQDWVQMTDSLVSELIAKEKMAVEDKKRGIRNKGITFADFCDGQERKLQLVSTPPSQPRITRAPETRCRKEECYTETKIIEKHYYHEREVPVPVPAQTAMPSPMQMAPPPPISMPPFFFNFNYTEVDVRNNVRFDRRRRVPHYNPYSHHNPYQGYRPYPHYGTKPLPYHRGYGGQSFQPYRIGY